MAEEISTVIHQSVAAIVTHSNAGFLQQTPLGPVSPQLTTCYWTHTSSGLRDLIRGQLPWKQHCYTTIAGGNGYEPESPIGTWLKTQSRYINIIKQGEGDDSWFWLVWLIQ